jgi:hypothetical protein
MVPRMRPWNGTELPESVGLFAELPRRIFVELLGGDETIPVILPRVARAQFAPKRGRSARGGLSHNYSQNEFSVDGLPASALENGRAIFGGPQL